MIRTTPLQYKGGVTAQQFVCDGCGALSEKRYDSYFFNDFIYGGDNGGWRFTLQGGSVRAYCPVCSEKKGFA